MNLQYLRDLGNALEIVRDAGFESFCNVTTKTEMRCLSYGIDARFISMACKKKNIAALIVPYEFRDNEELLESGKGIALSNNPKSVFYHMHNELSKKREHNYMWQDDCYNHIGMNCKIHKTAIIAGKNVRIGDNVTIEENVIIREGVEIGDNVRIMPGAIVGGESGVCYRDMDGNYRPIMQLGKTRIGNYVNIGSYAVIDRGMFPYETTQVGDYSQIASDVAIAHNVDIGKNVVILGQCQVCGNTVVEDGAHLSPRSIVSNRLRIEEDADVAIGSVVVKNVKKGKRVAGNYAIDNDKFLLWHLKKLRVNTGEGGGRKLVHPASSHRESDFQCREGASLCA